MRVHRISTLLQWQECADAWNKMAAPSPFVRFEWLASWWKYYGADRQLYILCVTDTLGRPVGFAPFVQSKHPAAGSVLELLGSEGACSDYMQILSAEGYETTVVNAIAQWMLRAVLAPGGQVDEDDTGEDACTNYWDLLKIEGVAQGDAGIEQLRLQLRHGGCQVEDRQSPNCWRIELPATWEEYLARLSKSHRKQVRRVERRFFDTGRAVFRTAENPAGLNFGMELLQYLHQQRWQRRGEAGCFADTRFFEFLTETGLRLFNSGRHEMHWVELDSRPVAVEYHLVDGNVVYAYQAGVLPEVLDEEPGRLFNIGAIRRAIGLKRSAYDFARGDEPYKPHWRAEPCRMRQLRIIPPVTGAWLRNAVWTTGRQMRNWLRSGLTNIGVQSET